MGRSFLFKVCFIFIAFSLHSYLFCNVTERLIEDFFKSYLKHFVFLHTEYTQNEQRYKSNKGNREAYQAYRDTYLEYAIMIKTSLSYKLQHNDRTVLGIINKVCRARQCEDDKRELIRILREQVQLPTEQEGLRAVPVQPSEPRPIIVFYNAFTRFLGNIYVTRKDQARDLIFLFFLSQCSRFRKYLFTSLPHVFCEREKNAYLHDLVKRPFSCGINVLIRDFLISYANFFGTLYNKYMQGVRQYNVARKDSRSCKKYLNACIAAEWDLILMERSSLSYKLRHKDRATLGIINKICRRRECEENKRLLTEVEEDKALLSVIEEDRTLLSEILKKQVQKMQLPEEMQASECEFPEAVPISILYRHFMQLLCEIYEKRDGQDRFAGFYFFLNQFTKIRKYVFTFLPRVFLSREANRYLHSFIKRPFLCLNRSDIRAEQNEGTPAVCVRVKEVPDNARLGRSNSA